MGTADSGNEMNLDRIKSSFAGMSAESRAQLRRNAETWKDGSNPERQAFGNRLLQFMDGEEESELRDRQRRISNLSLAERVTESFTLRPPTDTERKVLETLLTHPDRTSSGLSAACGWDGQAWHAHFGSMCRNRRSELGEPPISARRGEDFYSALLADFSEDGSTWRMKPEVASSLADLGIPPTRR